MAFPNYLPLLFLAGWAGWTASTTEAAPNQESPTGQQYRPWIQEMKNAPRGPFHGILWYCKDGTILPPGPDACSGHGGGIQHGEWNDRTLTIRKAGFHIANFLAELKDNPFVGPKADLATLKQILLEQSLVRLDDGWIFRQARFYRGAFQSEDESKAAVKLLLGLLADPLWLAPSRHLLLMETVRLFPLAGDDTQAARVRRLSQDLNDRDAGFRPLRIKIHSTPDPGDAEQVRKYARGKTTPPNEGLQKGYAELAQAIDALYTAHAYRAVLDQLRARTKNAELQTRIPTALADLTPETSPASRLSVAAGLMATLRDALPLNTPPGERLLMLQGILSLEQEVFATLATLLAEAPTATRRERLALLNTIAQSLYGSGLLSARQLAAVAGSVQRLYQEGRPTVLTYRREVNTLGRVAMWSQRNFSFHFQDLWAAWSPLEPLVPLHAQDRLRGAPLLFFSQVGELLERDSNRLAQLEHRLFGHPIGHGLRALNPGRAQGVLRQPAANEPITDPKGIYLLPETLADLPRVGGILTQGEGNLLSHIQLLARNLAIPNVVVAEAVLPRLLPHLGERVTLQVTLDGMVTLEAAPADANTKPEPPPPGTLRLSPDLAKLNLDERRLIPLEQLRAADAGRVAGPKSANLGELTHLFGNQVPSGVVIPFGVFRQLLDQPLQPKGPSVFEWMRTSYAQIAALPDSSPERSAQVTAFLTRLREWIAKSDPGPELQQALREALTARFGKDGTYGVFVRSDTNVEDLPGFTGAGLNQTVPNVVGMKAILQAIRQVWASPFTERAYSWRQAHMTDPEYVFPAVLVQHSFPSEKSGVMVTADVAWGEPGWLTIAVNEGVGGAVDGQAAESLRVYAATREVQLLAQATATQRRELNTGPAGDFRLVPASGSDTVLQPEEIRQLVELAKTIPDRFPSLEGRPADVEFAFRAGRLALLQIRPFVEGKSPLQGSRFGTATRESRSETATISLDEPPTSEPKE